MSTFLPLTETSEDDILVCVICARNVVDPLLLSCLHSACSKCTEGILSDSLTCPMCHVTTIAPAAKTNLIVSSLAQRSLILKDVFSCTQCIREGTPNSVAVLWCYTCQQSLCVDCQKDQSKLHYTHEQTSLDGNTNLSELYRPPARSCTKHDKQVHFACFTCLSGRCSKCVHDCYTSSHDVHPLDGSDALKRMEDRVIQATHVLSELNTSLTHLQDHLNLPEKVLSVREESLDTLKNAKKSAIDSISDAYDNSAESLLESWDSILAHASSLREDIECLNRRVSWTNRYCKIILRSNDIAGLLPQLDVVVSSLEALLEEARRFHGPVDPSKLVRLNTWLPSDLNLIASGWFGQAKVALDYLNPSVKDLTAEDNIDYYKRKVSTLKELELILQNQKEQQELVENERQEMEKLQSEFIIKDQELVAAHREVEKIVHQQNELHDQLELESRKLKQQQTELISRSQQLVESENERKKLEDQQKELQKRYERELMQLQSEFSSKTQQLEKEKKILQDQQKELQTRHEREINQLQSEVSSKTHLLVSKDTEKQKLIHQQEDKQKAFDKERQQLQTELKLKTQQLVAKDNEKQKLLQQQEDKQKGFDREREKLQTELKTKAQQLVAAQKEVKKIQDQQKELLEQLESERRTVKQLQKNIDSKKQPLAAGTNTLRLETKLHGTFNGPSRCYDVAVTPAGRVLVAAMADGLKEYDATSFHEIATWKPDADLLGYNIIGGCVTTVEALSDGRSVVGLTLKKIVLLRRDVVNTGYSGSSNATKVWRVDRCVAVLQAQPRRLSVWDDRLLAVLEDRYDQGWQPGPCLTLLSLSDLDKQKQRLELGFDANSVVLTDCVVIVASANEVELTDTSLFGRGKRKSYVLDCFSHGGNRLWRHVFGDGSKIMSVCSDSVGVVMYAAKYSGSVVALSVNNGQELRTVIKLRDTEIGAAYAIALDKATHRIMALITQVGGDEPNSISIFNVA